ncbi:class I SAM-dependent methyltransferase [Miltoncostaea oceani]|uniref:class I SAM-dependent methyltransferase n=1 Tax=Miltoncostaea oceani TaxID=2843216 RepID=UPI001C3DDBEF|nr:class I SAM-dependent methyltransferase [Miltoncostaea oceani]
MTGARNATSTGADRGRGHPIFAALYDRSLASAERGWLGDQRRALLGAAEGVVLEIGAGTGANLPHMPATATSIVLSEPDPAMRRRLVARVERSGRAGVLVDPSPAERLDMPDGSVDTVITTLALCSVADPARALAEARRVLRPGGRLLFLEHVRGAGRRARWQDRITPVWRRAAAGCHLDRDTVAAIRDAGFVVESVRITDDGPGLRVAKPYAVGSAVTPA